MLIDWFTVIAQAINFLVLVVVLKFVLYDRVIAVIDRRQAGITEQIERARKRETEAAAASERFERLRDELDGERDQLLSTARSAADDERHRLVASARDEVETMRSRWIEGIERERQRLLAALEQRAADELIALSEQALRDLADARLEEQIVAVALQQLADTGFELVVDADGAPSAGVATALPLADAQCEHVVERVRELLGQQVEVVVDEDPDLICGLEIRVGDHAFGWSVATYLQALRRRVDAYLQDELGLERVGGSSGATS